MPGADGKPVPLGDPRPHALVLSAVLVDGSGARVALAEGPGEYATYDLSPAGAALGHDVAWMLAPDEAWDLVDHLGSMCEAPVVKPAPLPKDAKPVSPYP